MKNYFCKRISRSSRHKCAALASPKTAAKGRLKSKEHFETAGLGRVKIGTTRESARHDDDQLKREDHARQVSAGAVIRDLHF